MLTLSPDELRELTGRRRSDAQARALEHMGIPFSARPNGTLAVLRSLAERALGSDGTIKPPAREPQLQP
jgi:hypothetical protein